MRGDISLIREQLNNTRGYWCKTVAQTTVQYYERIATTVLVAHYMIKLLLSFAIYNSADPLLCNDFNSLRCTD